MEVETSHRIVFKQGTESKVIDHSLTVDYLCSHQTTRGGEVISKVLVEVEVSFK